MDRFRALVRRRARLRCEYCRLPEAVSPIGPFQLEHIVARKHKGPTSLSNLALACDRCNLFKGSDLTGIDPITEEITRLFHPRRMKWSKHFRWNGPVLVGRTAVGRTTIGVLQINHEDRVDLRQSLLDEGVLL